MAPSSLAVCLALLACAAALPTPDSPPSLEEVEDDLDVEGLIDMQSRPSAVLEMNAPQAGAVMPSSSDASVVMSEGASPLPNKATEHEEEAPLQAFQNMEGEVEATGVSHPEQAMQVPAAQFPSQASPGAVLPTMNALVATAEVRNSKVNTAVPAGVEVDSSMPGNSAKPASSAEFSDGMPRENKDNSDDDDDAPIPFQTITPQSADANVKNEEAKMNDDVGEVEEETNPALVMAASASRMNEAEIVSNGHTDEEPVALPASYSAGASSAVSMDMNNIQAKAPSQESDDDDDNGEGAMNASEMNAPSNSNSASSMNKGASRKKAAAAPPVVFEEPSAYNTMNTLKSKPSAPAVTHATFAPPSPAKATPQLKLVDQLDMATPEDEKDAAKFSPNDMERASGQEMQQVPSVPAEMPSVSQGVMQEPASPEGPSEVATEMSAALVSEMQQPEKPVVAAPARESAEEATQRLMNGGGDGAQMGNVALGPVKTSSQEQGGYMDQAVGDSEFFGQMNTVKPGLDMMSTVASFLQQSDDQYATQAEQLQPMFGSMGSMPTHPYGLPYFHKDPFMPLQTPYYHIPAFDSPQKNPALTPYYNPYVNPPPPVPPSVPAAPSFFPYHHPQHMIPPYFPYPPAPVLQPGPFPPYAIASHLAPGQLHPNAKFSKLPSKLSDDPF